MSETTAQATHELLLGMNRDMKNVLRALETISQQLADQTMTFGPALGMCGSCCEVWIAAGENAESPVSAAVTVVIAEGVGAVPVCMWHFREVHKAQQSSRLLVAMPQESGNGLIVPGR